MKSVRLDADLEAQLRQAAQAAGVSESEFIRQAVAERSQHFLGDGLEQRLAGVVGAIHSRGGRAGEASRQYVRLLKRGKGRTSKQPS